MSEATDLQNRLILAVQDAYPGSRLWRNNVGLAYPVTSFKRAWAFLCKGITPSWFRPVKYGVVGSGDISGWLAIDGRAITLHIEVKVGKDKQSDEQRVFMDVLRKHGGVYIVARSVEQALADIAAVAK